MRHSSGKYRFFFMIIATALLTIGIVASAHADSSTASTVTGTSEHSITMPSILDQTYINYFAIFHGPQVDHLSSPNAVDRGGNINPRMGMYFDSEITAAYKLTPSMGVGAVVPFLFSPVMGQGITMGDLGVKVYDKKAIHTSNFNLEANLILQAPTSKSSQARDMKFGIKTTPAIRYNIPASRFAVGSWNEAKTYLGVNPKALDKKTFKLYTAPYVNYQLTSKLSLNLEYEVEAHHDAGMTGAKFEMYQTDLQPGFVYMFSHNLIVNPYLQVFTGNNVSDKMALGAVITATL